MSLKKALIIIQWSLSYSICARGSLVVIANKSKNTFDRSSPSIPLLSFSSINLSFSRIPKQQQSLSLTPSNLPVVLSVSFSFNFPTIPLSYSPSLLLSPLSPLFSYHVIILRPWKKILWLFQPPSIFTSRSPILHSLLSHHPWLMVHHQFVTKHAPFNAQNQAQHTPKITVFPWVKTLMNFLCQVFTILLCYLAPWMVILSAPSENLQQLTIYMMPLGLWKKDYKRKIAKQGFWKKDCKGKIEKERMRKKDCERKIVKERLGEKYCERKIERVKDWKRCGKSFLTVSPHFCLVKKKRGFGPTDAMDRHRDQHMDGWSVWGG